MGDLSRGEALIAVVLCLGMAGGAAYGWLAGGTVWATLGGALLIGVAALLVVTLVDLAVAGLARLLGRREGR